MEPVKNPMRNTPADKGRDKDPELRDESAAQPGVNTMSSSDYDDDNEDLTETASDSFREDDSDEGADADLDDVDEDQDDDIA